MKISNGMAEIYTFAPHRNRVASEKLYTWPVYDAGKVSRVTGVDRRPESSIAYIKPTVEDHHKLIESLSASSYREYSSQGKVTPLRYPSYQTGMFFDALA